MAATPDSDLPALALKLTGRALDAAVLPALLRAGPAREASTAADPFLAAGTFEVVRAFDLSPAGRAAVDGVHDERVEVHPGQVLVLELADGTTLVTSAARLHEDLQRVAPDAGATETGVLVLDRVRPRGVVSRGLGDSLGRLVAKLFVLDRGAASDAILDEAIDKVRDWAGDALAERLRERAAWRISTLATRALMQAIESRLPRSPGLYRWRDDGLTPDARQLDGAVRSGEPLLIFIHGTGSSTEGAFADLRAAAQAAQADWDTLEARYPGRIYALEHRTFSDSPIENALLLVRALPQGARVDLVTHSRGGLVGDLLAADWSNEGQTGSLIDNYRRLVHGDEPETAESLADLAAADERDRGDLRALVAELRQRRITVGRYVRVAAPAGGTRLVGANLDLFLSGLLALFGMIPLLQGSLAYQALRRITLEIARNRLDAHQVPGIEPMRPGSALACLLRRATPQAGMQLGVIGGNADVQHGLGLRRLVDFLADWALHERQDNDLVVDTASMSAGLGGGAAGGQLMLEGAEDGLPVDHFHYFLLGRSRRALVDWLTAANPADLTRFERLSRDITPVLPRSALASPVARGGQAGRLPIVVVLPGIMGSHLQRGTNRIWFDVADLLRGGLAQLAYQPGDRTAVSADGLFEWYYGDLCTHLDRTHEVIRFPYDWRQPVQDVAVDLARMLGEVLARTQSSGQPVRLLTHSMGGLVVRALAAREPALFDALLSRDGARWVMLGTPNQGSHAMVEMLLGKGDTLRKLAMLDVRHDLQRVLDLVAGFRGALQLLPRPGVVDGDASRVDYYDPATWAAFRPQVFDAWFGNGKVGVPDEAACREARALWALIDRPGTPPWPAHHAGKVIYVCGQADNTPCGVVSVGKRLKMRGTSAGDGTVTWASARIDGIGQAYRMAAAHGDLASTEAHFDALTDLLVLGETRRLPFGWPDGTRRGAGDVPSATIVYDAGPTVVPTAQELERGLLGATTRRRARHRAAPMPVLQVACVAQDLRHARDPILVGHYERDPIAAAEAVIDRDVVDRELTLREHLGLYPGPVGTATVVLVERNDEERRQGTRRGAVVTGLGAFGELSVAALTEAVRAAALRYLLAVIEREPPVGTEGVREVRLCSLLLGHNSAAAISIEDSVQALVRGVLEANRQFAQSLSGRMRARIVRLEIVECSIDVAISAAKALRGVARRLAADEALFGMQIVAEEVLRQGPGVRPRLEVLSQRGYWPQLIVTAASDTDAGPPTTPASQRARVPDRLRYVYLSQRARAEAEMLQSQPGLIETLVSQSIHRPHYDHGLSRTLFQLMVPLDFKATARQTDALALLLDPWTANLPWELLCADDKPLVLSTAMVRQFVSTQWRRRVRASTDKQAYVIGNPSTQGFGRAFTLPGQAVRSDPQPLPGAQDEALAVAACLRSAGYQVIEAIGADQRALDVINRLFQRAYRVLHIAAHGEFEIVAADGRARTGVLLSDGLMLTAAEVGQMEVVPDFVFLNCCHLGTLDDGAGASPSAYNRLAGSLARELIDMGVRAVIVAGWAVDDAAGRCFAEAFYRLFLTEGRAFGQAVYHARCETYRSWPMTNTWGAFQAYGDPGFLIEPMRAHGGGGADGGEPEPFVAPQELVDAIDRAGERFSRLGVRTDKRVTPQALKRELAALLGRGPDEWALRGDVRSAVTRAKASARGGDPGEVVLAGEAMPAENATVRAGAPALATRSADAFARYFSLAELVRSDAATRQGIDNTPGEQEITCLEALCGAVLDPLREHLGRRVQVNSGYRSPALNRYLGGATSSQHLRGQAADIQVPGLSVLALFQTIIRLGLPFDQIIYEARDARTQWVHVSHVAGGGRGEIRTARFDANGRPVAYPVITREAALALTEATTRDASTPTEGALAYHEGPDEPARSRRKRPSPT